MNDLFATEIVDRDVHQRATARFAKAGIRLPKITELARPDTIDASLLDELNAIDPDASHPLNLFRVHWHNGSDRRRKADTPAYIELPKQLTGVSARIVVAIGDRFPMIAAHKVLAAYGCLVPRLVTGQFDLKISAPYGRPPAITAAAAWRSRPSWARAALPCCRRA